MILHIAGTAIEAFVPNKIFVRKPKLELFQQLEALAEIEEAR
eukprot:CAMPEP_0180483974 /NCGR_PEP_ID=MMETSP1036_2-20121128/35703_1 /TAXON_ID=632150 /ORGANISM="Azadinium spinosum, Strain 3D9" /LENGTH=41 /DNA_ID= /DNA_START= /DNA_END= /DNA_ORIENTATION=